MISSSPPEGMVEYLMELTAPYDKPFPLIPGILRAVCYATPKRIADEHNLCKTTLRPIYVVTDDLEVVIILFDHKGVNQQVILANVSKGLEDIPSALVKKFWDGPVKYVNRGGGFLIEEVNR